MLVKVRPTKVVEDREVDGVTYPGTLVHQHFLKVGSGDDARLLAPGEVHEIELEDTEEETAEDILDRLVASGAVKVVKDDEEAKGKGYKVAPPTRIQQEKDEPERRRERAGKGEDRPIGG